MSQQKLSFAFFGTPELVVPILNTLLENGYTPKVVVTMPDRPQGRKMAITPPPAKVWAESHGIPVLQPEKLDDAFFLEIENLKMDIGIVVAYGKIIPKKLLELPAHGMLNVHYSLLPKYRGATPVESAILSGDMETGVAIQQMEFKLDSGPILKTAKTPINENETASELRTRLNDMAKDMLVETLGGIENGTAVAVPQNESLATHCGKIKKEDGLIDLSADPYQNFLKYRAYFGWPGVYFFEEKNSPPTPDGVGRASKKIRLKVTSAEFVDGKFIIKRVVPEGKKEMSYDDFLRNQ